MTKSRRRIDRKGDSKWRRRESNPKPICKLAQKAVISKGDDTKTESSRDCNYAIMRPRDDSGTISEADLLRAIVVAADANDPESVKFLVRELQQLRAKRKRSKR